MGRFAHGALMLALAVLLSGTGGLIARSDCATECLDDSKQDPCRDAGMPCGSCAACPCAHRAPVVVPTLATTLVAVIADRPEEARAVAPAAPALDRPFQPPRG
jgi:hypothetical protein